MREDPTTLDLIRGIAERGALAQLFVLITARPEFRAPWGTRSHHATISLSPLDRHQVRDMVTGLAARHALSKEVVEGVAERTAGVPLFVEELTRLLLERGEQGGVQAIPPTLQQSLTARLDRLGSAREVAQVGAVIGRDFSYRLVRSVATINDALLQAALEQLAEADILLVQGVPPDSDYHFKHALIQDAAYENLLKSRRQTLHRRVAEVLLHQFPATAVTEPELLAHHFTQAGATEAAIEWWGKAGQRSLERSALLEAVEQLTRGLDQISTLPGTPALRGAQIKLQVALASALMHTKGYAAPETKASLDKARSLIERSDALGEALEDPLLLFSVLYGFWIANVMTFNGNAVRELSMQFMALAEQQGTTVALMIGHRLMGMSLLTTGDIAEGRVHFDRASALYDPAEHRPLATRFGVESAVLIFGYRSWALWILGYPEAALADANRSISGARAIDQAATLMFGLTVASFTQMTCANYATANVQIGELVALSDEKNAPTWKALGLLFGGWLLAQRGRPSEAVQMITSGLAAYRSIRATYHAPLFLAYLAGAYAELGQLDQGWRWIGEAIKTVESTRETWCEAEVNRIAGEIALKSSEHAKAETYFNRALTVARQQQAKSWELRAAMSMARLWRDQNKREQARELLAPVYGWFTEGFDTRDLKEAKALLEQLADEDPSIALR